jgi:3-methyladenine DNA glycosylase/8-oxoguanine DNA glycosylase
VDVAEPCSPGEQHGDADHTQYADVPSHEAARVEMLHARPRRALRQARPEPSGEPPALVTATSDVAVPRTLTRATLQDGVRALAARDPVLAAIVARHGPPPLWARAQGFPTLVRIILEQQVSLASAATLFARVARTIPGGVTPDAVRAVGAAGLRTLGLTRQKAGYVATLAERPRSADDPTPRRPRCSCAVRASVHGRRPSTC